MSSTPSLSELYTPKLVTILREGYTRRNFRSDLIAGLTVAVVALPLSMAIAIASGVSPAQGLHTAIIGGILVSLLGGSRFQVGGPAGAFIVVVATTVQLHGLDGLMLATVLAGLLLVLAGFLKLGTYIKFIPYPVTVGFTAGIAMIIFASQVKDLLGLTLAQAEPVALLEKLRVIGASLPTFNPATVVLAVATILIIVAIKRFRPQWPGMLLAVAACSAAAALLDLPLATIGSVFGGIPRSLPAPSLPDVSFLKLQAVFPSAVSFALLGSIESLLSAVVADGMTGRRHRSNCELVAQGVANIVSGLFGGICVTGLIARTATNVRAGAHGPVAGMLHGVFLLLFVVVAAPLASYIPLASLAGILTVVAWNMIDRHAIAMLMRASRGDAVVLLATFLVTIFRDLGTGILVGFSIGALLFIHRMSTTTAISAKLPPVPEDRADDANGGRTPYDESGAADPGVVVFRISGAFFFGAAAAIGSVFDRIGETCQTLVVDLSAVPFLDSTAAQTLDGLARRCNRRGVALVLTGTLPEVRRQLVAYGLGEPRVRYDMAAGLPAGKAATGGTSSS